MIIVGGNRVVKDRHDMVKTAIFMKSLKMTTLLYMTGLCVQEKWILRIFSILKMKMDLRQPVGGTQHTAQNRDPRFA